MDNIQDGQVFPTLTPMPKVAGKAMTMDFPDAIGEIMNGNKVTRLLWENSDHCLLKDGWLTIFTKGKYHKWLVNDGDLEGQDWIIMKEVL